MWYDEETDRYYRTRRDCERDKVLNKVRRGEIHPIEGFSRYSVFEDGTVLNLSRAAPVSIRTNGALPIVSLVNDLGFQTTVPVARLVALHFIPQPDDDAYYEVGYKDGDRLNVHVDNLVWIPRWKRLTDPKNYSS